MAFTPDGLPCIGFLRPGLVIAAGYNGYGGAIRPPQDMQLPRWRSRMLFQIGCRKKFFRHGGC